MGGAVKSLSFAVDLYNQNVTGEISMPVQSARCDPHHLPCVIEVYNSIGGGIRGTLDSSYFKGQGERQGIEREYIVECYRNDSRPSDSEDK